MNKRLVIYYCSAITQGRRMVRLGIISLEDYGKIDHALLEKYNLSFSSLYRDMALIYKENRGNITH